MRNVENDMLDANFTAMELQSLKDFFQGLTPANLRLPINVVAMITPLVLLLPLKLSTWTWNKSDMLQVSFDIIRCTVDI